ncbi:MAG: LysR substrate-binding domain-containing protein [Stellaceae bacterium]
MDRVVSMQAFVQVVDSGSFSRAAKRLNVSPAVVTGRVQSLERRLGVQLLNRTTRKVNLTEIGRGFYERSRRILAELEEAEGLASEQQSTPRGVLRLNTSVSLARLVTPLIADYVARYPDVSFELVMSDRMVDMVEEGFDLALRSGPLPNSTLRLRRLGVGGMALCASPAYLARHGRPERPEDLAEHNCLLYINSHLEGHWHFDGPDGPHDVDVAGNLRSNSIESLRAAALVGLGICLLPTLNISDDLMTGHLVRLLPDYRTTEVVVQAVYPPGRHVSVKLRTFLDFLVERLCQGRVMPMLPKVANL